MGSWGAGLYANDFAIDLRTAIRAITRLPASADELLGLVQQVGGAAAGDAADPDHSTFWLVTADQFRRLGIECPAARQRAQEIIADGSDCAALARAGADRRLLDARQAVLAQLGVDLAGPAAKRDRKVLREPQPLVAAAGDAFAYPVNDRGEAINPYLAGKSWAIATAWAPAAWGAWVVAECGLAFGYLAWYRPLVAAQEFCRPPRLDELWPPRPWRLDRPGTLSTRHLGALQCAALGRLTINAERLSQRFPDRPSPLSAVCSDISVANAIHVRERAVAAGAGTALNELADLATMMA